MYSSLSQDYDVAVGYREVSAVAISLLLHALFIASWHMSPSIPEPKLFRVSVLQSPVASRLRERSVGQKEAPVPVRPEPAQQRVSPSLAEKAEPKVPTKLLSESATAAEHEQVHRGDSLATETHPKAAKPQPIKSSSPQRTAPAPSPGAGSLVLNQAKVLEAIANADSHQALSESGGSSGRATGLSASSMREVEGQRAAKLQEYQPFARQDLSSALFGSNAGISDYLPNIPDGDLTLLNTKADKHAVFVRRVALQVFGALRRLNWQGVPFGEAHRLEDFTTVHAVLSKEGKLLKVELVGKSGSSAFDGVVVDAAKTGSWDQNPPASASAEDGNIHFVFKARTWAKRGPDAVGEQRWLLLATGLL